MNKFPGKVIPTKDHSFRVEVTDDELSNRSVTQKDFWGRWLDTTKEANEDWNSLTEEQKTAYQKENYETEKLFYRKDKNGEPVLCMKWTLNSDWTWTIWDLEKSIEYLHCYPTGIKNENTDVPNSDGVLEEFKYKLDKINS